MLRVIATCVFGRHRHLSREFASFVLTILFIFGCVHNCLSEVLGKALPENTFKVSLFSLCNGKFFARINERFCPYLDCYGRECSPNFSPEKFAPVRIFRQKNFVPVWAMMLLNFLH